jgi:hypothetical protein
MTDAGIETGAQSVQVQLYWRGLRSLTKQQENGTTVKQHVPQNKICVFPPHDYSQ